jgi:hypothetical protein
MTSLNISNGETHFNVSDGETRLNIDDDYPNRDKFYHGDDGTGLLKGTRTDIMSGWYASAALGYANLEDRFAGPVDSGPTDAADLPQMPEHARPEYDRGMTELDAKLTADVAALDKS